MNDNMREETCGDKMSSDANSWHVKLFPEEYDFMYDSFSNASQRKRGENPMSAEYIKKTNLRRAALGFTPYEVGESVPNNTTLSWVEEKIAAGATSTLEAILENRSKEDLREAKELERKITQPSALDIQIDQILASGAFSIDDENPDKPENMAIRLQGALIQIMPQSHTARVFQQQIRRILPGFEDAEYDDLRRSAMNEWMDAYE